MNLSHIGHNRVDGIKLFEVAQELTMRIVRGGCQKADVLRYREDC